MTNLFSISELSKITAFSRSFITKFLINSKDFKKITIKNQIKYKTDLDLELIKTIFSEKKSENKKRIGNKNALKKTRNE